MLSISMEEQTMLMAAKIFRAHFEVSTRSEQ